MNVFLYLTFFISILIKYTLSQTSNYCDTTKNCDSCTICGQDTKNYCSCNFYNSYCLNSETNVNDFSNDFIINYDGCLSSNGDNQDICGSSDLSLVSEQTKTLTYKSNSKSDFFCYYTIKGSKNNNNRITITLKKNGNDKQNFDLYIITYPVEGSTTVSMLSDSLLNNNNQIQLEKLNFEKMSIYFDIADANNLDKLTLSFLYRDSSSNNNDDSTRTVTSKSSNSTNTGIIIGIIVGVVALIAIITVFIVLCRKYRKRKLESIINSNTTTGTISQNPEYLSLIKTNREKLDNMFKNELIPKIYQEKNVTNDCYNCTICMEKFIDNTSTIITTKCNHSFHENCFKNWVYKNIICPKCPNCNYLFLGPVAPNFQNMTISSYNDYTIQTNANINTININKNTITNSN